MPGHKRTLRRAYYDFWIATADVDFDEDDTAQQWWGRVWSVVPIDDMRRIGDWSPEGRSAREILEFERWLDEGPMV